VFLDRITLLALMVALAGCRDRGDDDVVASGTGDEMSTGESTAANTWDPADTGDTGEPDTPTQAASQRASLKRKSPDAFARDLSRGLGIGTDALCLELSRYDCTGAHRIALGGVDPYDRAVYEPLAEPGISSPLAIDRIALGACGERVARDFAGEQQMFAEIADGDATPQERALVAERLIRSLLRRAGEPHEIEAIVALADDPAVHDARMWGQLACFAVATTLENVFY
jgi:hypothetical protein